MARQTKAQIAAIEAANLQAAQQAELKRLRAEKAANTRKQRKAKVVEHVAAVQPDTVHADLESMFDDIKLPSAGRVAIGCILALAASGVAGYGIGMLMAYALAGIMMLTSTAWIAFTLSVLVWVLGIYAAWKVGGFVAGRVFASVVLPEGLASRSYESVANAAANTKATIGGWFSAKKEAVEQFTGAHTKVA